MLLAAIAATASSAVAPWAFAAQTITISGPSGTFGDDAVVCATGATTPCAFNRTFTFTTPVGFNLASATISSVIAGTNTQTNIDLTTVTLNGVNLNSITTGDSEFRNLLNQSLTTGGTMLVVNGTIGGDGSFSGTLSFAATATGAVPKAPTWAMMLVGFGGAGYSLRRRRATTRIAVAA